VNGPCILNLVMPCRFGDILASRAIRAAHCLTSIQVVLFLFICICVHFSMSIDSIYLAF
jgi:hypothetical protein